MNAIVSYTQGYPCLLQEYGKIVWDLTPDPPITREHVTTALDAELDESFLRRVRGLAA